MNTMIKCLPKEVQAKLRSGINMPSLQQCVEELVLNSIDAEATCVGIRMDVEAFKVQVIDNGAGMSAENMEFVGNRYHTSKCGSVEDLDRLSWYGFRGEALASIASLATLVEISSRTRSSAKTHIKIFKDGKDLGVVEAETARPSSGTTTIICNFFHNMPVRRKRMDAVLEGERIRHRVEAISLMHPSVSFTLKNDCTGAMMVQLPKARNTYHRFVQIHSLSRAQKLGEINYTHRQFEVTGFIGREGHYNNSLQFLYVNERLLLKTRIHKLLNYLLRRLSSLTQKTDSPEGQSAIRSPKHKRSQELNGVFIINIKCSYSEYDICLEPAKTLIEFKDWDGILLCIEEAVKAFLKRENLISLVSQDDFDNVSPKLFGTHNTDQDGNGNGSCGQAINSTSTLDLRIGIKLASNPVHRKHKDSVCQETEQLGHKKNIANEFEKVICEGSTNNDRRDELSHYLARLEPISYKYITEEEGATSNKTGEVSKTLYISSSDKQQDSGNVELSEEMERMIDNSASTNNMTSLDSIAQQIQPGLECIEEISDFQGTKRHKKAVVVNKMISLSNPYIHDSLQTPDSVQVNKPVFQPHILSNKHENRNLSSKHKISLDEGCDRPSIIPSKIPRMPNCPKLFLCKELGSLEKFRRVYGKSDELRLPPQESREEQNTKPQTKTFLLSLQNVLFSQEDQQECDRTAKGETQDSLGKPTALSNFTGLKRGSVQNKGQKSLAAKLSNLKQHRTDDSKVYPHLSKTVSQHNHSVSGGYNGFQDRNNNRNNCGTALNPESLMDCQTDAQLVEREESTASGDWLHCYDTSVAKTVYVNKVTGLSRYKDLPAEEVQVCCTSDVTNMAVSVISEMGEFVVFR